MNFFFVDVEIPPKVIMVPFRVPSSLPPSQGVLRLHSQRDCHPYVETRQIQDEKCPQNCTSKCLEIPFRLASSIRQILLIADKTDYQPGETGTVFFESLTSLFSSGAEPSFFQLWTPILTHWSKNMFFVHNYIEIDEIFEFLSPEF